MIAVTSSGDVLTVGVRRPDRRNALNADTIGQLQKRHRRGLGCRRWRPGAHKGQGTVFCSGIDLSAQGSSSTHDLIDDLLDRAVALNRAIDSCPVPVIAAISGLAIGDGVQMAAICDLRVFDPTAFFQLPVAKYGLAADTLTVRRLSSFVGHGRARAMLLAADKLGADEALNCGIANRVGALSDPEQWA